jgi:ubiquinone/menaquinone biosynthesis C-methylase UbiE
MLTTMYTMLGRIWPWFRKVTKLGMYQFMAKIHQKKSWSFMNYGYAPLEEGAEMLSLDHADEPNRTCIQLYHHVAGAVDLRGKRVLEVGSGRGGGADYVQRYLKPHTMVGVDYSARAVGLSNRHYGAQRVGLGYVPGDAEALPFDDDSFDAVINVESSHCYRAMPTFLAEVHRVLRPGGHFLFADFRSGDHLTDLDGQLRRSGLVEQRRQDITSNVMQALDIDHARKRAQIEQNAPWWVTKLFAQFAGLKGSRIYRQFQGRELIYMSFVLQKAG